MCVYMRVCVCTDVQKNKKNKVAKASPHQMRFTLHVYTHKLWIFFVLLFTVASVEKIRGDVLEL